MPAVRRSTEEEDLMAIRNKILEEKREYLCKYIKPETHFPYLRSKSILSQDDQEKIQHEVTSKGKASVFLDTLLTKGPDAYMELVNSLRKDKTQMFIVEMLNKEYETRKNRYQAGNYQNQKVQLLVDKKQLPKPPKKDEHIAEAKDKNNETVTHNGQSQANIGCASSGQLQHGGCASSGQPQHGQTEKIYAISAMNTIETLQREELDKISSRREENNVSDKCRHCGCEPCTKVKLEELSIKPNETSA